MIHKLLNLTRPLFVIDTETTGVDVKNDRIIELGFQMWAGGGPCKNCENQLTALKAGLITEIPLCEHCNGSGFIEGGLQKEYRTLVNPGVPIPAEATAVHGITDAQFVGCRVCGGNPHGSPIEPDAPNGMICMCSEFKPIPTFKQLATNLARGLSNCDFAGKNVRFDLRIISAEFARSGVEWNYLGARVIDAERLEQLAVPRTLSNLYEKYTGQKHEGAHGALSDVRALTVVIESQLVEHSEKLYGATGLPHSLDALHKLQWPGWIDGDGKFRFVNNVACFSNWGKHANKPMHKVESGYYDFILKGDFSADVKKIAAEAKMKKFPEVK